MAGQAASRLRPRNPSSFRPSKDVHFPLTPALSLRETENRPQPASESNIFDVRQNERCYSLSPGVRGTERPSAMSGGTVKMRSAGSGVLPRTPSIPVGKNPLGFLYLLFGTREAELHFPGSARDDYFDGRQTTALHAQVKLLMGFVNSMALKTVHGSASIARHPNAMTNIAGASRPRRRKTKKPTGQAGAHLSMNQGWGRLVPRAH